MNPLKTEEIIQNLKAEDPFFDTGNTDENQRIGWSMKSLVWTAGPYLVVFKNQPLVDNDRYEQLIDCLHHQMTQFHSSNIRLANGAIERKRLPDGRLDVNNARLAYAFNSKKAAAFFATYVETKLNIPVRSFELTDAGPDPRRIIYHSGPQDPSP
ncbi:MAG: hypothetical protein ACXW30_05925 [Micavibrio sp.]